MRPERAEQMLREYKNNVGRRGFLEKAIMEAETDLAYWRSRLAEDMVGGAQNLDGMPHGTTVGNPTEKMALKLATGYEPEDLKDAERRLAEMRTELRALEMEIVFVEAWLAGLSQKDRWLLERIYFEGFTYNETARAYAELYGIQISRDAVRRMKREAVQKVAEMAR